MKSKKHFQFFFSSLMNSTSHQFGWLVAKKSASTNKLREEIWIIFSASEIFALDDQRKRQQANLLIVVFCVMFLLHRIWINKSLWFSSLIDKLFWFLLQQFICIYKSLWFSSSLICMNRLFWFCLRRFESINCFGFLL